MIKAAVDHLKHGGIVIFPTDTVYAVSCAIGNKSAIKRLSQIRGDSPNKPQLILASSFLQAFEYGFFDKRARDLAEIFWPGPLTIVVFAKEKVPTEIRGADDTVGIRVPNQPPIIEIIKRLGEPVIAPSANFHGKKTPSSFDEIDKQLISLVDYALDTTNLPKAEKMLKVPSTIVDLTKSPYRIIRTGAVNLRRLERALEEPKE